MRLFAPLLGLVVGLGSAPVSAEQPRAVLELFTSQGCSSCPKADRLAGELAREKGILVLTFPVDYWDYLGWKDTFGSAANSARQRAYAMQRGDRKVFTPQMVINGRVSAIGSDRAAIINAIETTSRDRELLSVPVSITEADGKIEVSLAEHALCESEVWLIAVAGERTVEIEGGENKDHTVRYTNVVRRMTRLGAWTGKPAHFTVAREEAMPPDADRYLVLVQKGSGSMPGTILGVHAAAY